MDDLDGLRWISAPLIAEFSLESENRAEFKLEFDKFAESDDDPLGEWLKLARSRGETKESDPALLAMTIDLHRKIDELTRFVKGEEVRRVKLTHKSRLDGLNYTHFRIEAPELNVGERYYARIIAMPVFPIRDIGLYFTASSERIAALSLLHDRDQKAWDGYVASRERAMIRQMKERQ
ncbi:MAG: hypothetical protein LBF86_04870 [Helicobacteraceae bacterium]|jgi:hypothetical protein|nr:hypothetical protein [Helicobacteraceae bacterium]